MTTDTAITDRDSAIAWLMGRINYEHAAQMPYRARHFKLRRMERLLELLGDPHLRLPAVHIAGTKGKGSTAVMIESILRAAGYRTGLYTSPHLQRLEERFVLDGRPCDEAAFVEITGRVQAAVESLDRQTDATAEPPATFFEITTAVAMLLFTQHNVDIAVLEVGLGGRLDSTNVCHPLVSVITSISYDHTQQLGNTLTSIAREKAGIIKPGVSVISGAGGDEATAVVRAVAADQNCRLRELGVDFGYEYRGRASHDGAGFHCELDYWSEAAGDVVRWRDLNLSLLGRHQAANAALALAVFEELKYDGLGSPSYCVGEDSIRRGLAAATCPARIELIRRRPAIVLDVAHNVASAMALVEVLRETFPAATNRTLIFGASGDKDANGILRTLLPAFDRVIFTRYQHNPRTADPVELSRQPILSEVAGRRDSCEFRYEICEPPAVALQRALAAADEDSLICIAGSFFLAAEMQPLLAR